MKNKYIIATILAAIMVLSVVAFLPGVLAGKGNGAPAGPHYNLNLISVPKGVDMDNIEFKNDNSKGHVIFVKESGRSLIYLEESPDGKFHVIDRYADKDGALFQLPAPDNYVDTDPDTGEILEFVPGVYQVWARARGPSGTVTMTTCGIDDEDAEVCSLYSYVTVREPGENKKFDHVTMELTTITYYNEDTEKWVTADIFDEDFETYFWGYLNDGVKILQLRFYPLETINKEF